jgi:hypothetical protein
VKTLRFICFASLLAIFLFFIATASSPGSAMAPRQEKLPTLQDLSGNTTPENRHGSGSIAITMTGIVGDPGDLGGE